MKRLILLFLLSATAAEAQSLEDERYGQCIAIVREKPADGETAANAWRLKGGGSRARQCLGMAFIAQGRFAAAAAAFEQGARAAESAKDGNAPALWAQAGNAALQAGDNANAESWLGSALVGAGDDRTRGELLIDRATALVALGKTAAARVDLDRAVKLAPADADGWLLSATLARRENQLKRAEADVAEAAKYAPGDPDVLLEQGNIAGLAGRVDEAKSLWRAVVNGAPQSPAAKRAAAALTANGG